ncbi:MAG: choice-of-anchor tandem repeat GloVer-containing protein [Candidatus Sulfotelmatobacter sp.]
MKTISASSAIILHKWYVWLVLMLLAMGLTASAQTPSYTVIHGFNGSAASGSGPVGNLVEDAAGSFYGVTSQSTDTEGYCYDTGCGAIFKLFKTASGGWASENLHTFTGDFDGDSPQGGLVFDAAGNLYGTTAYGGVDYLGNVFELTPASSGGWKYSVIYTFSYPETGGAVPSGPLVVDSRGNLYGTAGGGDGYGIIFELSPSSSGTWVETVLYSFQTETTGSRPQGPLVFDSAGNLYGTTYSGGEFGYGTVFEAFAPAGSGGWALTPLYSFSGRSDGKYPWYAGLIFDSAGNLYGTTSGGGHDSQCAGGCGVVYELSPNNATGIWTQAVIHSFMGSGDGPGAGGAWPEYSLTADASGSLYGATYLGGKDGLGVVYKLTQSGGSWTESVVHYFSGGSAGAYPLQSGVVFGTDGDLYGLTFSGGIGPDCCGTLFRVAP